MLRGLILYIRMWQALFSFLKFQRGGIYTVTHAGRLGAVVEQVPQVRPALSAGYFDTNHTETAVGDRSNLFVVYGLPKTRPARTGIILAFGIKKLITAANTAINPVFVMIVIFSRKGAFGTFPACNFILLACQTLLPLAVISVIFIGHTLPAFINCPSGAAAKCFDLISRRFRLQAGY